MSAGSSGRAQRPLIDRSEVLSLSGPPMPFPRLELFVREFTPAGRAARLQVERLCSEGLRRAVELTVTDVERHPDAARDAGVLLVPTLVRRDQPGEPRAFGNFSDADATARALGLELEPS